MSSSRVFWLIIALTVAIIFVPPNASAHEPHECPDGYPENPVLSGHIDQAEVVNGALPFNELFSVGQGLFEAIFNHCDGQGRPATTGTGEKRGADEPNFIRTSAPDSNACAGCHNQPRSGGGGDFVSNVFVLAQAMDPVMESVSAEFSNERNTLGLFGAGPIEMLSREMTIELQSIREAALQEAANRNAVVSKTLISKGVNFGSITAYLDGSVDNSEIKGVDADLIIKPFHQAGVVRSIREFTINAMNHHHGMQAAERFDLNLEKGPDFDEDGVTNELTMGDITAITIYQAALGTPGQVLPRDPSERRTVTAGEELFKQIGCSSCHVPKMILESRFYVEPNPMNLPGTFHNVNQSFS